MSWFIDNDALLKLATYDLFDLTLTTLNIKAKEVQILSTAKYVLLPAKQRLRLCGTEECAQRLESFITKAAKLNADSVNPEMLDTFSGIVNINAGEAILFAMAASLPDSHVITGDKRAIKALNGLEYAHNVLTGRIFPLEILLKLIIERDFEQIQANVRSNPSADTALTIAFGHSTPATFESTQSALNSYIEHLRKQTGNLLYLPPANS